MVEDRVSLTAWKRVTVMARLCLRRIFVGEAVQRTETMPGT